MMPGSVEWVPGGAEADGRLVALVAELQGEDPLAPVWVAVRAPAVALHLRRFFGQRNRGFGGVRFAPLSRLVETIGASSELLEGRVPLTEAALRAACRVELAALSARPTSRAPGRRSSLAGVADHAATEAALAQSYRMLADLEPGAVARLARLSPRAAEVVRLASGARKRLRGDFFDLTELVEAAISVLDGDGADLDDIGSVVLHLPDPLTGRERRLLEALARGTTVVVLAGKSGDERADAALRRSVAKLGFSAPAEEEAARARTDRRFERLYSLPDVDGEVAMAVRLLVGHATTGGDLGRCILTFPAAAAELDYPGRLAAAIAAAGLPSCGTGLRLDSRPEARLVLALAGLAAGEGDDLRLDRHDVVSLLGSGAFDPGSELAAGLGHLFTHRADGDAGLASGRLDRCSRAAGVVRGLHQWQSRLGAYSRQPLERCQPGAPPEAAADLAVLVGRLAGLLGRARAATSWEALAGWLSATASDLVRSSPARDQVLDAIGDLGRLATVEPLGELAPARRCGRLVAALEVVLDRPERSHGRFGCGPLVGALGAVCGVGAELTVVLGCVEGALPGHLGDDPLLPRHERDRVEGAEDVERADERDRRLIVSILHSSGRALASAPRTAPGGRSVMPSRWLDPSSLGGPTVSVPSFAAALERVASGADACADATEYELAGLLACRRSRHGVRQHFLLASGDISERLERARSRRRSGLSRFAGDLTAVARDLGANAIWDRPFSPTTLESLATCPFRFLADQLLRVVPLAAPEELDTIDARERGSLMHDILEEYFRPFVEAPAPLADIPAPQGPAGTGGGGGGGAELPGFLGPAERARLLEIVDAHFERLEQQGRTGRALFWKIERGRIRRDLERFVARELESAHRRRSRPVRLELSFGHERPLVIAAGGRKVAFRGRMDRVDVEAGRDMVVIDYKSGSSVSYRSLLCDPLGAGRHLQLPIYAKAAAAVLGEPSTGSIRSEYRFISAEAAFEVAPVELNEEVATALTSTLSTLVGVVEAGTFPPNPGTLGDARPGRADSAGPNCQWCDYDGLCTTDRLELWRRARSDKRMSAYVELTESGGQTS